MLSVSRLLILLSLTAPYAAQAQNEEPSKFESFKQELISPVTTEAKTVFWTGTASTLLLATALRHSLVDETQQEFQRQKPFGKTSVYGDVLGQLVPNVIYVGSQAAAERWGGSENGYRRSILMTKATIYASAATMVLKLTVREQRPNGGDHLSFPSGHATTAFAFASVVAAEHSLAWGLGAYSMAIFVALSRINDNAHYLHDVVAGATLGTSFGLGLYYLQPEAKKNQKASFYILPQTDGWLAMTRYSF